MAGRSDARASRTTGPVAPASSTTPASLPPKEGRQVGRPAQPARRAQDALGAGADGGGGSVDAQPGRVRQDGRQQRGVLGIERRGGLPEEALARRLHAEDARAELREVEVDLEDAALRPERLDPDREPRLEPLAQPAAARPEEEVLGHLLADRAGAAHAAAALPLLPGVADRVEVEAAVGR